MKIYSDSLKQNEAHIFDLGIVEAGESRLFKFYIVNETKCTLKELDFKINHNEVKILSAPKVLESNEEGELIIEWCPSVTLKEGLKTNLLIEGKEIWK